MMRLSPSELYAMTLREFFSAYQGWQRLEEQRVRTDMERARWMAGAIIAPWVKGNKPLTELLPLPWDNVGQQPAEKPLDYDPTDIAARRERVANLLKHQRNE